MEWDYRVIVERVGKGVEVIGVAIIVVGLLYATWCFLQTMQDRPFSVQYRTFRRSLGRSILLGLEFLVAGDIISTVAVDPTFRSVGVLAIVVAIRTFLSLELEMEIEGRWPWQRPPDDSAGT